MGFYGTLTGIVYVAAPLIGGVIGDLLGWRLTFYISVPMTVIVLLILLFRMENIRPSGPQADLDWIGTGLLCGATIGIVMMFSWGGQKYPWFSAPVLFMAVMFLVCTVCFIHYIQKAANPIFSVRLFTNREFVLVILSVVLIGPSMFSVGSYLSLQSITCFILRILRDRLIITDLKISAHNNSPCGGRFSGYRRGCCYSIKTNSHLHQIPVALPQTKFQHLYFSLLHPAVLLRSRFSPYAKYPESTQS